MKTIPPFLLFSLVPLNCYLNNHYIVNENIYHIYIIHRIVSSILCWHIYNKLGAFTIIFYEVNFERICFNGFF